MLEACPEKFNILFNYSKCRFESICQQVHSDIIKQINSDLILFDFSSKIISDLKENIITQICKSSISIPIKYLSEMVKENKDDVMKVVFRLITSRSISCRIDLVDEIIVSVNSDKTSDTLKKALQLSEKNYYQVAYKLVS